MATPARVTLVVAGVDDEIAGLQTRRSLLRSRPRGGSTRPQACEQSSKANGSGR